MTTRQTIEKAIEILGYATAPHLERFFPESKSPYRMLNAQLNRMEKEGVIKKRILTASCKWLNRTIYFIDDPEVFEPKEWQHQFALKDVEAAFLYHYGFVKGYEVFITDRVRLKEKKDKYYRPDAFMRIATPDKTFNFYIELERSRKGRELTNKMKQSAYSEYQIPYKTHTPDEQPLFNEPISKQTKFLYVIASKQSDCFERPPFSENRLDLDVKNIPARKNIPLNVFCSPLSAVVFDPSTSIWIDPTTVKLEKLIK